MNKSSFLKGFSVIAVGCIVLLLAGGNARAAGDECSIAGAWFGSCSIGPTWVDNFNPGLTATSGQCILEWVLVDPTLGGYFPTAVKGTPGVGVWKWNKDIHNYDFTFVNYGLDAGGQIVWVGRTSGTGELTDCDHVVFDFGLEVWMPGQDMNTDPPVACISGTGSKTRVQHAQPVCR
jgi:hypothetical protein